MTSSLRPRDPGIGAVLSLVVPGIGQFYADFVVENIVLLELKSADKLTPEHSAQVLHYLKATRHELGLLLNFGPRPEIRRLIFDNERKGTLSWVD